MCFIGSITAKTSVNSLLLLLLLQDRIHEHADEFLDLMSSDDCIFYFCGLKRMYTSVLDMLEVSQLTCSSIPSVCRPQRPCPARVQHGAVL